MKPKRVSSRRRGQSTPWPVAAARLAALFPRERLDEAVVRWADAAPARQRWSIAFSGGADSLVLLLLVWAHWPKRRSYLRVLHFNHRLRGAESRADLVFSRQVAASLGVTFVSGEWMEAQADASEAEARRARLEFLAGNGRVIWFGHQQDDVAESLLMRLARGSGTSGLAAPRPIHVWPRARTHLRPLIGLKKREIVAALQAVGVSWREDSTNPDPRYFRNRVRHAVIPEWATAAQRDALAGAARSRSLLEEDDAALEAWLDELVPPGGSRRLPLSVLQGKPRAIMRRALHRWIVSESRGAELSRQAFESLLVSLEQGKSTRHSLGRQGFAVTDGVELWFESGRKKERKFQGRAN